MHASVSCSLLFAFLLAISSGGCFGARPTSVVRTVYGPVQGEILKTVWNSIEYSSFKGIPYARPPVGNLRFKPPIKPKQWHRTLNTTQEPSMCPQVDSDPQTVNGNEDCLYLSVFTPETAFAKQSVPQKPVMVWIYGGSFISGYINTTLYGPDFFIEEDVVMVSLNYRLGALGFLYLDHPEVPGNAALKDQVMALEWVRDNIAKFGGDPGRVTIFGESSGGTAVNLLAMSDLSKDLFHRSIIMSGAAVSEYQTAEEALQSSKKLAELLDFHQDDKDRLLSFLRRASVGDIVRSTTRMSMQNRAAPLPFRPMVEKPRNNCAAFITECPLILLEGGKFKQHPTMIGMVKNEGIFFYDEGLQLGNVGDFVRAVLDLMVANKTAYSFPEFEEVVARWRRDIATGTVDKISKVATDILFTAPIDLTRRLMVERNGNHPVYFYRVSYESEYQIHKVLGVQLNGTSHFDDVGYLFNVKWINAPTDPNHSFNKFRKKMVTLWTNFAKYGNPTPPEHSSLFDAIWIPSGDSESQYSESQFDINEKFTNGNFVDDSVKTFERFMKASLRATSC